MNSKIHESYNIFFERETGNVVLNWQGRPNGRELKEGIELILALLNAYNASKVLANIKGMTLLGADIQQWMHMDFLPKAVQKGFKTCAIVRPDTYVSSVLLESISYKILNQKISIHFFDNDQEARKWLKEFQN